MSDIDLDGIAGAIPDGCLSDLFITGFNWFPVPTVLTVGSIIAHGMNEESAPVFHGLQDVAAYYTGAVIGVVFMGLAKAERNFRNNLLVTFAGAALFATSALAAPNYFEDWFGKDDPANKNKIEQKAPVKTDSTKAPAANW